MQKRNDWADTQLEYQEEEIRSVVIINKKKI